MPPHGSCRISGLRKRGALSRRVVSKRALAGSGDVCDEGGRLGQQESIEPAAGYVNPIDEIIDRIGGNVLGDLSASFIAGVGTLVWR